MPTTMRIPDVFTRYRPAVDAGLRSALDEDSALFGMLRYHMGWTDEHGRPYRGQQRQGGPPSALSLQRRVGGRLGGAGPPRRRRHRAHPQLFARPRRHPGRRYTAAAPPHRMEPLGHQPRTQCRGRHERRRQPRGPRPAQWPLGGDRAAGEPHPDACLRGDDRRPGARRQLRAAPPGQRRRLSDHDR